MYCQPQTFTGVARFHLIPTVCKKSDAVKKRKEKFKNELAPFVKTYGKDMMNAFYKFWSELNKSQTRMRWEFERTWELSKRLARWDLSNFTKNTPTSAMNNSNYTPPQTIDHSNRP